MVRLSLSRKDELAVSTDVSGGAQLAAAAALNTRLFLNCVAGVSDEDAARRPSELVNNLGFIACHILDARFYLGRFLGMPLDNPLDSVLGNAASIDDVAVLPPLDTVRQHWTAVSADVLACIAALTPGELMLPSPQRFPIPDATMSGAVEFQLHHESYHIGQLAYLRKFYGYPAMSYR
jgi:hypothetical protein